MNFRHLFFIASAFLTIFSFASCKKDDNKSKTELLTTGTWKISAYTSTSGSVTVDRLALMEACNKDDIFIFKADNTITFDEGASKCDAEDDQSYNGVWSFLENETKILLDGQTATLVSLNGSELKVEYSYNDDDVQVTDKITFVH